MLLEGVQPVEVLAIPRSAVLSDQQGDYVFVVGADNKAEQRRIQLGQSTPTIAAVTSGLSLGEKVIVEGLQRVRPGQPVAPGPASALIQSSMKANRRKAAAPETAADRAEAGGHQPMISVGLRRSSAPCDRDRVRHHHRRRAGAAADSGGAVSRHRAAAGHGHRQLSRRLRRGGRSRASPSRSRRRSSASTRCST